MKTKKIIIFGFILALVVSCGKYLEPYPNGNYDSEQIWQYQNLVQGLIGYCYDNINSYSSGNSYRNYNDNEGVYLDGATDDAVVTSTTNVMSRYAVNSMTTGQDPFAWYWDRDYRSIRNCNLFLKDRRGYNTKYIINTTWNNLTRNRLQGEAFALRAYFQWDLLQKFGGKGLNGQMLGFPIVTDVYDAGDKVNLARNTYDDCVKQILADCDSAYKYLPIAHRDYLVPAADRGYAGGKYWGRFDGISMRALKAMVYLTWASPRFNPSSLVARWDSAAYNAKKVMDFKSTIDVVSGNTNSFSATAGVVFTNPNSAEIVIGTRYNSNNTNMERLFYPGGYQGTGSIGATQELVDAFPDSLGYPISVSTIYNPAKPYAKRDPRFYANIFYNTATANRSNDKTKPMYTFENWNLPVPGKDAAGTKTDNNRTNYYIKKYVFMGWNPTDVPVVSTTHSKFLIRWTHMVLIFAEAANHVTHDPNVARYSMTPKAAIKLLRVRKTYDNVAGLSATDPYLDAQTTEAQFDALVRNERRIETCFEGMRFYDLRRWTTDADWLTVINAPVHGANITQVNATTYTYDFTTVVEERKFPSPYNPLPFSECLRMSNLIQNEGWSSWN
jgi:hypothetical protein